MDRDSTMFLTEKGVRVVGIDAWSWDRPLPYQAKEFKETGDPKVNWEAHFAGIEIGYCHMEKPASLPQPPSCLEKFFPKLKVPAMWFYAPPPAADSGRRPKSASG